MTITLRHYQAGCTPALIKHLRKKPDSHPLVAMPTGSGKTYCIADLVQHVRSKWNTKVLIISHVKEILEQNHASLSTYLTESVGLNSAGLGRREYQAVTVAGIQSIYRNPERFKSYNLIIVDEAHLISTDENTMYHKFLKGIGKYTCIGFTATPFRLGSGYIYGDDNLFSHLVYDWTSIDRFQQLVDEGYLAKLTTKRTKLEMDTKDIKLKGGDYNEKQLSDKFDREVVTEEAIKEILAAGRNRKKWLIFAIDISHAEHITETLLRNGVRAAPVHSTISDSGFEREKVIKGFKDGRYKCVVNVNILTTGFDDPGIDLIAMLRPTKSPVLHVQSLGRGSRVQEDKNNCLVLDFAGNTARLGPINDVLVKTKKKTNGEGEAVTKTCPECNSILPPAVRICPDCGFKFTFEHNLSATAIVSEVIESGRNKWLSVFDVKYEKHSNYGSPSSVKVTYSAEGYSVSEWICVEHKGFAKHKADHWVKYRGGLPCTTANDLLEQAQKLDKPKRILVKRNKKLLVIKDLEF